MPATVPFGSCTLGIEPSSSVAIPGSLNVYDFVSIPLPIPDSLGLRGGTLAAQAIALHVPPSVLRVELSPAWALQVGY